MIKKFFSAIRKGDTEIVRSLLEKQPALINATFQAPPKKYDGQSALQIAIRNQQFEIAHLLLDLGADVDFMESESCCCEWRVPVLQDAIMHAIMLSRWNVLQSDGTVEVFNTASKADAAYALLKRILLLGADIHCRDSYGNSCLQRAILDARQILPRYDHTTKQTRHDRVVTSELRSDLRRVFLLLLEAGADVNELDRYENIPLINLYNEEPVGEFLRMINTSIS